MKQATALKWLKQCWVDFRDGFDGAVQMFGRYARMAWRIFWLVPFVLTAVVLVLISFIGWGSRAAIDMLIEVIE